jgi:hypothetical protein
LLVGVSLVLRTSFKPSTADFWNRWAQIAAAALLVSVGSWLVFGPRLIYFGILHFVAAALLIARPLLRLGAANILLGAICVFVGLTCTNEFFNTPPANIGGFMTFKPRTEDYVPLFPWIGIVLIGAGAAAQWRVPDALRSPTTTPRAGCFSSGTWALTVVWSSADTVAAMTLMREVRFDVHDSVVRRRNARKLVRRQAIRVIESNRENCGTPHRLRSVCDPWFPRRTRGKTVDQSASSSAPTGAAVPDQTARQSAPADGSHDVSRRRRSASDT